MSQLRNVGENNQPSEDDCMLTVVLLGMNSEYKCLIGNAILGSQCFQSEKVKCERVDGTIADQRVCIINTSDLFHKSASDPESDSTEEIKPSYAGPRVFLLVLQDKHLSQEEMEMFNQLKERFGKNMVENTIIVLVNSEGQESANAIYDEKLKQLLDECEKRVYVHNKNQMTNTELIKQLIEKSKRMQENQAHESSRLVSDEERVYEEIDCSKQTQEKPEVSKMSEHSKGENVQMSGGDHMITVVLLGKGKNQCLIGNAIFRDQCFQSEKNTCKKVVGTVAGEEVAIINTSDLYPSLSPDPANDSIEEIKPSYPGPRVFLLVLQDEQFSQEEMEMFTQLRKRFGEKIVEYTIIVLIKKEEKLYENSLDKFDNFKKVQEECGNRVCTYCTKDMKNTDLIKQLKDLWDSRYQKSDKERTWTLNPPGSQQTATITSRNYNFINIVLLGQTGSGKSATGNTILGRSHFESNASSVPVTNVCQRAEAKVGKLRIRVIDTPDFFNEDLKNQADQMKMCKELTQQGPVVYLLVMHLGRFTEGEREVLPQLKREFGEDITEKTVILFTGKEKLKEKTLKDYINKTDPELRKLIHTCHSRCHAFNNNDKNSHQVKTLIDLILEMANIPIAKHDHKVNKGCRML